MTEPGFDRRFYYMDSSWPRAASRVDVSRMAEICGARSGRRLALCAGEDGDRSRRSAELPPGRCHRLAGAVGTVPAIRSMPAAASPPKRRGVDAVEAFVREHWLFLAFWGAIILLGTIEFLAPQIPGEADRSRRWFTNFGLGILIALIASSIPVATVASAWWAQQSHFGLLNLLAAPWWAALIVTVLVRSFAQYVYHVLCHKVPWLWRLHRVHHSDVHLDVSSALRSHPAGSDRECRISGAGDRDLRTIARGARRLRDR